MEFCAMPDHVTLMTEVVALCVDAGNHEAALALLSEHFDWLDAYEQTLLAHAAALSVGAPLRLVPTSWLALWPMGASWR